MAPLVLRDQTSKMVSNEPNYPLLHSRADRPRSLPGGQAKRGAVRTRAREIPTRARGIAPKDLESGSRYVIPA